MRPVALARWLLALLLPALAVAGCGWESLHRIYPVPFYDTHVRVKQSPEPSGTSAGRIAVLPFTFTQEDNRERRQAALELRESMCRGLSRVRGYEVVAPVDVDRRLEAAGITSRTLLAQTPESLGKITGADAVVYGDLERIANITMYVYSHTVYEGTFRLVDAASGEIIWSARLWEGRRAGLLVEGFFVDMFMSQPENKKLPDAYRRVADSMTAKLIETMPEAPLAPPARAKR